MARAIGATAISRVIRSDSMRRSTSSRSNRRCSRTLAPAAAAVSRLSRPRMWEGGVATWNRSSGPRPRAATQWAVAHPIERWVWRTALGRPVVPELKTSTASSSSEVAGSATFPPDPGDTPTGGVASRSVTRSEPSRPPRRSTAAPSATAWTGAVSSRAWRTSTSFQAGLRSTAAAPIRLMPLMATTNSGRLDVIRATRSPGPTPWSDSRRPNTALASSSSRKVQRRSSASTASRSPHRSAARCSASCIRAGIAKILLPEEIDVNIS